MRSMTEIEIGVGGSVIIGGHILTLMDIEGIAALFHIESDEAGQAVAAQISDAECFGMEFRNEDFV